MLKVKSIEELFTLPLGSIVDQTIIPIEELIPEDTFYVIYKDEIVYHITYKDIEINKEDKVELLIFGKKEYEMNYNLLDEEETIQNYDVAEVRVAYKHPNKGLLVVTRYTNPPKEAAQLLLPLEGGSVKIIND